MLIALMNLIFYATFVVILFYGVDPSKDIGKVRKTLIGYVGYFSMRLHCLLGSLCWMNVEYVSTGEGDYSKWLGKDWKP